uniref:Serpin family A member 6 n=1 Tax=Rousettus aegyptiacus TaxID=9407 RepID=A0A7J8ISE5_ROUAE|nr:serpin family A member 6 [Rousettus aegyptiacus]
MLLTFYACLLWLSCSGLWTIQAKEPNADESIVSNHRILAPSNTDFALDLFNYLVASAPGKNVLISPVSISMALAMLSLGARGHTRAQLFQSLGFNLTQIPEAEIHQGFRNVHRLLRESDDSLEMGNTVFLNQSLELLESFSADAKRYYELDALATDFQDWAGASRQINEYIKNKTQGEITDFFLELDSPDTLILVNYIFFRGTPTHPILTIPHLLLPRIITATKTQGTLLDRSFHFTKYMHICGSPSSPACGHSPSTRAAPGSRTSM